MILNRGGKLCQGVGALKRRAGTQVLAYEACDHTRTPLDTPKKKHALFDSKSFKVCGSLPV